MWNLSKHTRPMVLSKEVAVLQPPPEVCNVELAVHQNSVLHGAAIARWARCLA